MESAFNPKEAEHKKASHIGEASHSVCGMRGSISLRLPPSLSDRPSDGNRGGGNGSLARLKPRPTTHGASKGSSEKVIGQVTCTHTAKYSITTTICQETMLEIGLLQSHFQWGFGGRRPPRNILLWGAGAAEPPQRPTKRGLRGTASLALPTLQ